MRKPIIPAVVRTLRERRELSQKELAKQAGISKDALSRLELGKLSGTAERTQTALARALNVVPAVLTGDEEIPPVPASASEPKWDAPRDQWNIRVDSAVRNAFALTALRYRIPVTRIIEVAPYLFVAAAERSLERRRTRLKAVKQALKQADAEAEAFPHLPQTIASSPVAGKAIHAEEESIANRDLLAEQISDDLFVLDSPVRYEYDANEHNPFVVSLQEEAPDPELATITRFSRTDTESEVCPAEAMKLADDNDDLAIGILHGWAPLHEMPRELFSKDAVEGRVAWLRTKASEHEAAIAAMPQLVDLL